MTQLAFLFDPSRCFGCLGCVAACITANGTPDSVHWRRVHKLPPEPGLSRTTYLSVACNHCEQAPCVRGCPTEALAKHPEDGTVTHDPSRCMGCRYCQMTCPFEAPQWDASRQVISKCTLCPDRRREGLEPACVATCFAGALRVASLPEIQDALPAESCPGLPPMPEASPAFRVPSGIPAPFPPPIMERLP